MNVLLQKHGAKHVYKVPEGLRELCADIAREVLRSQPRNIYCFIADYVETLLITRENAKVAVKIVNNILLGSQAIVGILHRSGLSLEQIARAAPRIQKTFREYLDAADTRAAQVREEAVEYATCSCDEVSKVSLESILRDMGVQLEQAAKAATIIQAAFRGHYERMLLNESRGMIQWQRAATRTLEILRRAGVSQTEASKAAVLIQAAYRGYYTRRNLKMKMMEATLPQDEKEKRDETDVTEPRETIHAMVWMDAMFENSDLTLTRANEAASVIQKAYKRYRLNKKKYDESRMHPTMPMMMEAIVKDLYRKVFDQVVFRADFSNQEDLTEADDLLQRTFKDRSMHACMIERSDYNDGRYSSGLAKNREDARKMGIKSKRDEETDAYTREILLAKMGTEDWRNGIASAVECCPKAAD